jgi:hypothetical protein
MRSGGADARPAPGCLLSGPRAWSRGWSIPPLIREAWVPPDGWPDYSQSESGRNPLPMGAITIRTKALRSYPFTRGRNGIGGASS